MDKHEVEEAFYQNFLVESGSEKPITIRERTATIPPRIRGANPIDFKGPMDIEKLLEQSTTLPSPPLAQDLCVLLSLEDYSTTSSYKSLLIYEDGLIVRSEESTKRTMNRLFRETGISYPSMRNFQRTLLSEKGNRMPYVIGDFQWVPINGPSKKSVTWVNLTNCSSYIKVRGCKWETQFRFTNWHTFHLPVRHHHIQNSEEICKKVRTFQESLVQSRTFP